MSFQAYCNMQIRWARCLRRHLHLRNNEQAIMVWARQGYAKQFADKYQYLLEN